MKATTISEIGMIFLLICVNTYIGFKEGNQRVFGLCFEIGRLGKYRTNSGVPAKLKYIPLFKRVNSKFIF